MKKVSCVKIDGRNNPVEIYVSDVEKLREKYRSEYHTNNVLFVVEELDEYGEALAMLHSMIQITDRHMLSVLDNGLYGLRVEVDQYYFDETGSMHALAVKLGAWLVGLPGNVFETRREMMLM